MYLGWKILTTAVSTVLRIGMLILVASLFFFGLNGTWDLILDLWNSNASFTEKVQKVFVSTPNWFQDFFKVKGVN